MTSRRLITIMFGAVIALVTACGGASQSPSSHPASSSSSSSSSSSASGAGSGTSSKQKPASGIPQHGGGDHDADNSGGPSDGDGNI
jgi:hypothetical protein